MTNVLIIAGTRPNFIKLAPLYHTLESHAEVDVKICHTGQHYDAKMSDIFWQYLELPEPDFYLGVSGGSVPNIIGRTTIAIAELLEKPENIFDLVIVLGDVNATAAGAIAASQLNIPVMHIEAGLRSFDREMPEEINRVITDHVSDYLAVSEPSGLVNLKNEGIADEKVIYVGNIMIETLLKTKEKWSQVETPTEIANVKEYILTTFHRPENVDNSNTLELMINHLNQLAEKYPIVFPMHPRTKNRLEEKGLYDTLANNQNIYILAPQGYFDFLKLINNSIMVVTDSGGIQEETTALSKACITIRKNTERPITITEGTNKLLDITTSNFVAIALDHLNSIQGKQISPIEFWDDQVSNRILEIIKKVKI